MQVFSHMSKKAKWKNHQRDSERLAVVQTVFMAIPLRNNNSCLSLSVRRRGGACARLAACDACPRAAVSLRKPDHYTTFAAERNPANASDVFHLMFVDERLMQKVPRFARSAVCVLRIRRRLATDFAKPCPSLLFYGFSQNGCNAVDYILPFILLVRAVS
jgi:hypothetical protein